MKSFAAAFINTALAGIAVVALVVTTPLRSLAATQADNKKVPVKRTQAARALELWEKVVAAKGGRDRLRQITSLYVAADLGEGFRECTLYVFPDYRFEYSYWAARERTDIDVSNGRKGITWWQVDGDTARPRKYVAEDVYLHLLPQFIYLLITHDLDPVPLGSRKDSIGLTRVDVVETNANGWRVDYYLDSKTHLPVKVVLPWGPRARANGEMDQQVKLEDYTEVDGVMMPRKATYSFTTSPVRRTDRLTFEINPKYDQSIFEQPPTPKMGPEAWRLKGKTVASDPK